MTLKFLTICALSGAATALQDGVSLVRRNRDVLEVNGKVHWRIEEPKKQPHHNLGGTAANNVFAREEALLQEEAPNPIELEAQQPQSRRDRKERIAAVGGQPPKKGLPLQQRNNAKLSSRQSGRISQEAQQTPGSVKLKWKKADDPLCTGAACKCLWVDDAAGAANDEGELPVKVQLCTAYSDDSNEFVLPGNGCLDQSSADKCDVSSGLIQWKKDTSKCLYVNDGKQENSEAIYMKTCDTSSQAQNFTVYEPDNSGLTAISWSKNLMRYPSHCLDVDDDHPDQLNPRMTAQLFECSAGTMWIPIWPDSSF